VYRCPFASERGPVYHPRTPDGSLAGPSVEEPELAVERRTNLAGRPRIGRSVALAAILALSLAACGSSNAGGGGGDSGQIIAEIQSAFGTSMKSGVMENGTLTITLADSFGAGGAKLFMCSNVKDILAAHGATGTDVVMVSESGTTLSTMSDCR
jgi:hypothetical protein